MDREGHFETVEVPKCHVHEEVDYVSCPVESTGETARDMKINSEKCVEVERGVREGKTVTVKVVKEVGSDVTYDIAYETVKDEVCYGRGPEGSSKYHPGKQDYNLHFFLGIF